KGGKFTVNEPAVVTGLSGKPLAVVGEGLDKKGKPIPETLDAVKKNGKFEVQVDPHKPVSHGLALSLPGVPGFAPPNVGLTAPKPGSLAANQQLTQQRAVHASVNAAREQ